MWVTFKPLVSNKRAHQGSLRLQLVLLQEENKELGRFTIIVISGSKSYYLISQTQLWEMAQPKSTQGPAFLAHLSKVRRIAQGP